MTGAPEPDPTAAAPPREPLWQRALGGLALGLISFFGWLPEFVAYFWRWWLMALTTALSEADEMLLSMPTPQRTALWPSVSST